jgi:hypothetical protein
LFKITGIQIAATRSVLYASITRGLKNKGKRRWKLHRKLRRSMAAITNKRQPDQLNLWLSRRRAIASRELETVMSHCV